MPLSGNFAFLSSRNEQLAQLGALAERYFRGDPATAIFKLRQFAELLSKIVAARHAMYLGDRESFEETLRRLSYERIIPKEAAQARESLEQRLAREAEERGLWEQLAQDVENEKSQVSARLAALQLAAEQAPKSETIELIHLGEQASSKIDLDEAATRTLIDQQLRDAGWEADTKTIRYAEGSRPAKGRNVAIAEWPTKSGPADYALFAGLWAWSKPSANGKTFQRP